MTPKQLLQAGKVREAESALSSYLRQHPADVAERTFLFELLCFSGQYERAEKQLAVLAQANKDAELGAILYYAALHGERTRNATFSKQEFSQAPAPDPPPGKLNGKPFQTIRDADPEIGARLEVFAAGAYLWIPFANIRRIEMAAPTKLRDTLWAAAMVLTGPEFKEADLGEVIVPVIYPFSWKHPDENVWLGRMTDWGADEKGVEYPSGQKVFLVDGEEVPLLEVRTIEFDTAA